MSAWTIKEFLICDRPLKCEDINMINSSKIMFSISYVSANYYSIKMDIIFKCITFMKCLTVMQLDIKFLGP